MTTIKDIAKKAQVAVSTVSYALNDNGKITGETKTKILQIAKELNYKGKSGKSKLRTTKNILVVFHNYGSSILNQILQTLSAVLTANGYNMFFQAADNLTFDNYFCALIILNSKIPDSAILEVAEKNMPVLLLDRKLEHKNISSVTIENFEPLYKITTELLSLDCKTFAFISGPSDSYDSIERYNGYLAALKDNNISEKNTILLGGDFTKQSGKRAIEYIMMRPSFPDAIVCANDEIAEGVIEKLIKMKVDKKIFISGFDGIFPDNKDYENDNDTNNKNFIFFTAKVNREKIATFAAFTIIEMLKDKSNFIKKDLISQTTVYKYNF